MANWSQLVAPGDAPPEVQRALEAVQGLRGRVAEARKAIEGAQRGLVEAERGDRETMAQQLRNGTEPVSDVKAVQQAREAVDAARRRAQALDLAITDGEDELGEVVRAHRGKWLKSAERQERSARQRGRQALDDLTQALQALAEARTAAYWLRELVDREQRAPAAALGVLPGSERATGNRSPLAATQVLDWIAQAVAEPKLPPPPPEPQPLRPARWGAVIS